MATNFPDSPSTNDTHSVGDLTWIWDGTVWKLTVPSSLAPAGSNTQVQYNSSGSFAGSANFTFDGTSTVTLASTDAGSSAAPILELYRNSSSPADADYLGQIKFQGEDDGGAKVLYAKITGKIDDASNTTEDGIIEIAHMKAGSNNISARFTSSALKLINGTGLEVADGLLTLGSTAVTATAAELNILDGVTATASELNLLDGITAGTVSASLAVVPDSNKDISGFRNITSSGTGDITTKLEVLSDTEAHSGALAFYKSEAAGAARLDTNAVYGRLDFYGRTASDGYYLSAQMKALVGDSFSSDNQAPSDIEFSVTPVGQTAPVKKLVVKGGTATTDSAALEIWHPGGDNKGGRVDFIDHDGTGLGYFGYSNNANWYIKNNVSSGNMFIECEGAIYIRAEGEYELSLTSNGLEPYTDSGYKLGSSSKKFSEIHGDAIHIGGTEVTATAAELNLVDGITAGTVAASKAVIVDSDKDVTGFRNITATGEIDAATLDISGDADIDGTTNLDAVDIDGAVQIDNTVTVGESGTGYDVRFYGDTTGSYMEWDQDKDALWVTSSTNKTPDAHWSGQLTIAAGTPSAYKGGIAIDSTAMWVGHNSGARDLYLATNETARLKIAASGEVTQPNLPAFRASNTDTTGGTLGGLTGGAAVWPCNSESFDNGGNFNSSTGWFYAPVDGYYFLSFTIFMYTTYDNDTNTYFGIYTSNGHIIINHGASGSDGGHGVSGIFKLDAGDGAAPYKWSDSDYDMTTWRQGSYNQFSGALIG